MAEYPKKAQVKRRKKRKKQNKNTIPALEKDLWKFVSLAIRIDHATENGTCTCVTCGSQLYYYGTRHCHTGHFRSRREKQVKYEYKNLAPQCARCNTFAEGEQFLYGQYIDEKYGEGTAEELTRLGKQMFKITRDYIEDKKKWAVDLILKNANEKNLWDWKKGFTKAELKAFEDGM